MFYKICCYDITRDDERRVHAQLAYCQEFDNLLNLLRYLDYAIDEEIAFSLECRYAGDATWRPTTLAGLVGHISAA